MAQIVELPETPGLEDYAEIAHLASAVRALRADAARLTPPLRDRTVWMISSTAQGGGVAEMMPTLVSLLRDVGVDTRWVVIESDRTEFFALTKRLHNLIHGAGDPRLGPADRTLYESVNRQNADVIAGWLRPGDVVAVHDPQPLPLLPMLRERADVHTIWRCHIGLDEELPETRAVWDFLRPYTESCERTIFSAHEYVRPWLTARSTLIYPAIEPLGPKNRNLWLHRMVRVMVNSGLVHDEVGPVLTPRWDQPARRLLPSGSFAAADANGDIGLLTRPMVTQISRWDRLKGFGPLLDAFALLKRRLHAGDYDHRDPLRRRRLQLARLVVAGPDPAAIQDDPEALEVIAELKGKYLALSEDIQPDTAMLALPMQSREQNALMVNALQRASSLVVQNSLREGFGLTVAEAMWKQIPVLSNVRAVGPRQQIRDCVDGRLARDPEDVDELATMIEEMLSSPGERELWGRSAQRRAHDEFLAFTQVCRWLDVLNGLVSRPGTAL